MRKIFLICVLLFEINSISAQICVTLADKTIEINERCHYSDCSTYQCSHDLCIPTNPNLHTIISSKPVFRNLKFKAKFDSGCEYDGGSTDWNKLMKIAWLENMIFSEKRSIRLGWRWKPAPINAIELGIYAHIDHEDNSPGREFTSLNVFVSLNTWVDVVLMLNSDGMLAMANNQAVAIRRKIFDKDIWYETGITKNAYFEINGEKKDPAPHDMAIDVKDIQYDCIPFFETYETEGLSNSVFYDGETKCISASNTITASLPVEVPTQSVHTPYTSPFTVIENGANVTFAANKIILKPGFHVQAGAKFRATSPDAVGLCASTLKMASNNNNNNLFGAYPDSVVRINNADSMVKNVGDKSIQDTAIENRQKTAAENKLINQPNPFYKTTTISYSLQSTSQVTLSVFNVFGQRMATLVQNEKQEAGAFATVFDASNLSAGVYFYTLEVKGTGDVYKETKRMVVLR